MNIHKQRSGTFLLIVAALLFTVSGCVQESEVNGARVFHYETWVPLTVLLGGLAAIPIGWFLRNRTARGGWGLLILGPLAALFFAPTLYQDQIVVSSERLHVQSGIWGMTSVHTVDFEDIKEVRITAETTTSRRGKRTNYYFTCDKKSGGSSKIPVSGEIAEAAVKAILQQFVAHGVPIRDETGNQ